jgi:hypothetical protein
LVTTAVESCAFSAASVSSAGNGQLSPATMSLFSNSPACSSEQMRDAPQQGPPACAPGAVHRTEGFPAGPTSGLNQVEGWFALLADKQIKRGVHRSIQELGRVLIKPHRLQAICAVTTLHSTGTASPESSM